MEEPPLNSTLKDSPQLNETVLINVEVPFSSPSNFADMTDIEVARRHAINTRDIIFTQLAKLMKLQELLRSDLGVEKEEENLRVTRKLADQVLDASFKLSAGAGRLVDDIDCLISRLKEEKEQVGEESTKEEVDMMQIDGTQW